jgi:hypothetical protein
MIIIIGKDGTRRHEPDDYVLQDGETAYTPRYLMDHDPSASGRTQSSEKRYSWDGNTKFQLRRPGFRRYQDQGILAGIRDPAGPPEGHVTEQAAFQGCSRHDAQLGQPLASSAIGALPPYAIKRVNLSAGSFVRTSASSRPSSKSLLFTVISNFLSGKSARTSSSDGINATPRPRNGNDLPLSAV